MNQEYILQLASIVRDANDAIIGLTLDGVITSWNLAAQHIFGYSSEEATGRPISFLLTADLQDDFSPLLADVKQGLTVPHYEGVRLTKDDRVINVSLSISPIRDAKEKIAGVSCIARDITAQKQAEAALLPIEQASDAIYITDHMANFLDANSKALKLLGYTKQELLQLSAPDILAPEDHENLNEELIPTLHSYNPLFVERRLKRKDDTYFYAEISAEMLPDGRLQAIVRDVTDRKMAEQAIRQSELLYRSLVDIAPDGIVLTDAVGTIELCNLSAANLQGYLSTEYLLGRSLFDFVAPKDRDNFKRDIATAVSRGSIHDTEHHMLHRDGRIFPVELRAVRLPGPNGQSVRILAVIHDVTQRKLAATALQEKEMQLSEAQEIAHIGSWEFNIASGNTSWSDELYRIFGVAPQSHKAGTQAYISYAHPDDRARLRQELESGYVDGLSFEYDYRVVRPDGSERLIHTQCKVSSDDNGKPFKIVGIVQDITEQRQAEIARTARQAAEESNRAKSEFLSRMSHELRTPLNSIIGFGQLLKGEVTTADEKESVDYILKASRHLLRLINNVLDIARIEEGRLNISLESVYVRDVLQESLDLVRPLAATNEISLIMDDEDSRALLATGYVMADRQMLQQVLLNLLANAVKYNRENGAVSISCREISYDGTELPAVGGNWKPAAGSKIRIKVTDTGIGLSPDKVARLFTPLERLGAEQSNIEGTGLGLALSKHLIEAMGGVIGVVSAPGQGSTFWIELPVAEAHAAHLELGHTEPLSSLHLTDQSRTMLYIEDNLSNLRLIERILQKRPGISLISAIQGRIGLDMAFQHKPDVILLDLHLPDMTGNDVLKRLQENPETASIPVIMLSADANPRRIHELLDAGARAYLTKPINVDQLLRVLEETSDSAVE